MKLYGYLIFYLAVLFVKGNAELYCFTCDNCEEPFNNDIELLQICNAVTMIRPKPIAETPIPILDFEPIVTGTPPTVGHYYEPIYTGPPPNLTQGYEPINIGQPPIIPNEPIYTGPPPNLTEIYEPINIGQPLPTVHEPINIGQPLPTVHEPINIGQPLPTVHEPINIGQPLPTVHEPIYTGPPPNLTQDYEQIHLGPLPEVPLFAPIDVAPPPIIYDNLSRNISVRNAMPTDTNERFYCFHVVGIAADNTHVSRRGCVMYMADTTCRLAVNSMQFAEYYSCNTCDTSECNFGIALKGNSLFILISSALIFIILRLKN